MSRHVASQDKRSFSSILLRDGATLLILSILHVVFTVNSIDTNEVGVASVLPLFEEPLTSILTWRFLINLQKAKNRLASSSCSMAQMSDPCFVLQPPVADNFDGFIGSLGARLIIHEDIEDEDMSQY
ncbi:hypothetical protein BD309DRAFT_866959 [Dichomitus squalens]|uniref:Uncharacterized protein n=1 Tax=Dichomitus squalens TaxID=114155 RepID=A0A4Q9NNA8_9APHY|nr:hypothetical protein BD309DRAFT_866959 [Dichomitus squalens]TBU55196.1 hypothetical protein BD310DRAFT_1030509 [Dichomitus squalens]